MARQSKSWSWRHAIVKSGLAPTTRHVLLTISVFMNEAGDGCYPTTKQLSEATGLSERAVCEHISKATDAGWLTVSVHGFKGQKWKNHQYEAAWPDEEGTDPNDKKALILLPKGTDPNDKKALTEGQSTSPVTTPITSSLSERGSDGAQKPKRKITYPKAFEEFWLSYPRTPNMAKKEALDAWNKLDAEDRITCAAAVPAFRAFLKTKPDLEILHACRFISKRRFDGFAAQASEVAPKTITDADWQKRLAFGRNNRKWHVEVWGPLPGSADCRVPEHLLQQGDGQGWAVWEA